MNYTIRKAEISDIKIVNNFLTRLIQAEKRYDKKYYRKSIVYSF